MLLLRDNDWYNFDSVKEKSLIKITLAQHVQKAKYYDGTDNDDLFEQRNI